MSAPGRASTGSLISGGRSGCGLEGDDLTNLEEALERLHLRDLEYGSGLASHGSMAVEALESLGHQALIPAFLDLYVPRLPPAEAGEAMAAWESGAMRGRSDRRADWVATFEARLASGDWREVLAASLGELMPGLFAAAGHGLLRTAHAVRGLERTDSALRRRELARGLAHWSARYQELPGVPGAHAGSETLMELFSRVPRLGDPAARAELFFESVARLDHVPAFARAIEGAPRPAESAVDAFLGELGRIGALLYCTHPGARIAYVHAVTIPVALRGLMSYLDPSARGAAALHAFHAVAALHAIHGELDPRELLEGEIEDEVCRTAESWDEIRYRAACSLQEHAIKMAEACLRADRLGPDPIYRLAAADAALRLEGSRSAGGC